jgi:hypothetical protein
MEQRGAASLRDDLNGVVHEMGSYFDDRASGGISFKWKDCRIDARYRAGDGSTIRILAPPSVLKFQRYLK